MKKFYSFLIMLCTFIGISIVSSAQYIIIFVGPLPEYVQREESGVGYPFVSANLSQTFTMPDGTVTSFENKKMKSKIAYSIYSGTSFILSRLGTYNKGLGLNIGYQSDFIIWDQPLIQYGNTDNLSGIPDYSFNTLDLGMSNMYFNMGVPISVDFKFGNEVNLDRNIKWGAAVGAGIFPHFYMSDGLTGDFSLNTGMGYTPFVKAEFGFFAGMNFKLRAQYNIMTNPIFESEYTHLNNVVEKTKITAPGMFSLSLIMMPFSPWWEERGFWNNY